MLRKRATRLILPLALILVGAACGGGDTTAGAETGDELSGTINVSGSSTVAPITTRVAELFQDVEPGVNVNIDGPGTGDGFVLFCKGETDISDASRPIKKAEADDCAANGIDFIELKVAIDGMAVMTHPDNDAVTCLSFPDLYALAGPESQGLDNWSDAETLASELGSATEFPDLEFTMSAPGEESGTYDSFTEIALEGIGGERAEAGHISEDEAATTRPDYQSSSDDNIILQGIEGAEGSFGWVGYAYASEQGARVKLLEISEEPGGECVAPSDETIASAGYPLSRYLYIYVNHQKLEESPALEAFVDFYLGDGVDAVSEVGYVQLAAADRSATRDVWDARTTGTRDGGN